MRRMRLINAFPNAQLLRLVYLSSPPLSSLLRTGIDAFSSARCEVFKFIAYFVADSPLVVELELAIAVPRPDDRARSCQQRSDMIPP